MQDLETDFCDEFIKKYDSSDELFVRICFSLGPAYMEYTLYDEILSTSVAWCWYATIMRNAYEWHDNRKLH